MPCKQPLTPATTGVVGSGSKALGLHFKGFPSPDKIGTGPNGGVTGHPTAGAWPPVEGVTGNCVFHQILLGQGVLFENNFN